MQHRVRKRYGSTSVVESTADWSDRLVGERVDGVTTTTRYFCGGSEEVFTAFDGRGEWVDHLAREYHGACAGVDRENGRMGGSGGDQSGD